MKRRTNNKNLPKVTLILKKDGERQYLYPSIRKTQYFLHNKAELFIKKGYLITIRVSYGFGIDNFGKRVLFDNEGTYNDIESLKLAFKAFVKEYID